MVCGRNSSILLVSLCIGSWVYIYLSFTTTTTTSTTSCTRQIRDEGNEKKDGVPKVAFKDLSKCPPRPEYLSDYKSHCWRECVPGEHCSSPPTHADVDSQRARLFCVPNIHLIGVERAATADISQYFSSLPAFVTTSQVYTGSIGCPISHFKEANAISKVKPTTSWFNTAAGNLVQYTQVEMNKTHVILVSGIQLLSHMITPATKFYIQLRHPSERFVSQFFDWHAKQLIYRRFSSRALCTRTLDAIIRNGLDKLRACLNEYYELWCIYKVTYGPEDITPLLAQSVYIVFIEQLYKFIPREQVMIQSIEEYQQDTLKLAVSVTKDFFGEDFPEYKRKLRTDKVNEGIKDSLWSSTWEVLDEFYLPYNRRLAALLSDDKWLYPVNRSIH